RLRRGPPHAFTVFVPEARAPISGVAGSRPRPQAVHGPGYDRYRSVRRLLARAGFILAVSSLPSRPSRLRRCSLRSQPRPQLRALLLGWLWLASRRDRNQERSFTMAFQVEELSLELIEALVPLMPRIKQRDRALEDQLRRAASSIGLNCAEAAFSDPGNRRARLFTAAGSAGETRHALRQAIAWRLVTAGDAESALKLTERIIAILW